MQLVGEDPKKAIEGFSNDFKSEFIALLRTAHGEKAIGANRFYNEVIKHKEHVHMNATKWSSLTEFVKHLGREGIVTVKEDEKDGLMIAWRDTSVQAVRRREEIRAQEAAEAKNSMGEDKMLKRMAQRAKQEAEAKAQVAEAKKASQKRSEIPPVEANPTEAAGLPEKSESGPQADRDTLKSGAAPVKISFGLKNKAPLPNKAGLGQMKSQSIFSKRKLNENGEEKLETKKVKL